MREGREMTGKSFHGGSGDVKNEQSKKWPDKSLPLGVTRQRRDAFLRVDVANENEMSCLADAFGNKERAECQIYRPAAGPFGGRAESFGVQHELSFVC